MFLRTSPVLFLLFPLLCFFACASPKAPTGGEKDTKPPVIVEASSTPNRQTNFHDKEIIIVFDEWVTLKDIYSQVVISPLMPHNPDIRQKGKGIVIKLPDSLKSETTYTINFGNAIADLNEGNILENYAFVFSTGDALDSIQIIGTVSNAMTLKPADGVWVMLYPAGEDSAVYKRKPEYLAKTNKDGKWTMSNVRQDSFAVIALKDNNQNFLYDQEGELLGWLDSMIYTSQPLVQLPDIRVFPRENRKAIKEVIHVQPGWLKVIIDAPFPKPVPEFLPAIDSSMNIWDGDTLHIFYSPLKNYSGYAVLEMDTTRIRSSQQLQGNNLKAGIKLTSGRVRPGEKAIFLSALPIMSIDTSRILLTNDSLGIINFDIEKDKHDARQFAVSSSWLNYTKYNLTFLPGAILDFWGRTNDTLRQSIVSTAADQFGDLTMTIDGLDSTRQYILLIREGEHIKDTFVIDHQSGTQLIRKGLSPGTYILEMIEDLNKNGVWDTGNYENKRQPERKMIFTPDNLRAGWELEVKITWTLK